MPPETIFKSFQASFRTIEMVDGRIVSIQLNPYHLLSVRQSACRTIKETDTAH